MEPLSAVVCHVVPPEEPYWTDHPLRSTASVPRLNSSTKSFVYVAPELPPPPYACETTRSGEAADAGAAARPIAVMARARARTRRGMAPQPSACGGNLVASP